MVTEIKARPRARKRNSSRPHIIERPGDSGRRTGRLQRLCLAPGNRNRLDVVARRRVHRLWRDIAGAYSQRNRPQACAFERRKAAFQIRREKTGDCAG